MQSQFKFDNITLNNNHERCIQAKIFNFKNIKYKLIVATW